MANIDGYSEKAPHEAILDLPQERITGDILRGYGPRRGNLETLIRYWRPIMRKPGGFRRCLVILANHPELYPLERICAWLHHETTGLWPNEGNHHRGGKLGRVVKLVVKKPGRRNRRGKSDYVIPGVDFPIDRLERRLERKAGSTMYAPLDGTVGQLEYKSSRLKRVERGIVSVLLPGERGVLKPRHLLRVALTPGGSGLPGPSANLSPRRSMLWGGSSPTRGFRCPPGFERGGHFTDQRFSTCGRQLFGIPGSGRSALRTVAAAVQPTEEQRSAARARQKVGDRTRLRYKADSPTPGVGGGMPELPAAVGSPNETKQKNMVSKVLESMSGVREKTDAPIRRLVREDGSILQPLAPLSIIGKQKNNPDLRNASLLTRVNEPGKFGEEELMLMQTGLRSIEFSLPGGGSVSLKRNGGLMAPGQARAFGKAVAQARRQPITDMDYAGLLRETAAKTNAVTFAATVPGGGDASRIVRVTGPDGAKRVPFWVYKAFLSSSYKMVGEETEAPAEAGEKSLNDWPNKDWGPLQYTAALIPDYDAIDHTGGVDYKAAALSGYRKDITERFMEVKRIGSVWDRGINRFRCPPGMSNAGQITNRIGLGCGVPSLPDGGRGRGIDGLIRDIQGIDTTPGDRFGAVQNRVEAAVVGSVRTRDHGVLAGRRDDRDVGVWEAVQRRIGDIFNVPVDDAESAALRRRRERPDVLEAVQRRIGDVFNVPVDDAESAELARLRRPERERVGVLERMQRRIANAVNPQQLRLEREPYHLPTGMRADRAPDMERHNNRAAFDQLVLSRSKWNKRLGKQPWNDIEPDEPRRWMERNAIDLPEGDFEEFENDMLDFELLEHGFRGKAVEFNGNADELADMIDRLSLGLRGLVGQDAHGRRNKEIADAAIEASRQRRLREANAINLPAGLSIPEDKLKILEGTNNFPGHVRRINERIRRHNEDVERAKARVVAGRADKAEIDRAVADMVRNRDKYRADAAKLEGLDDAYDVEAYVGNMAIAEMYDRGLPELVGEALRFERLDKLKRDRDNNKLGKLIFNNPAELINVPFSEMPLFAGNNYDNFVIGIGNADSEDAVKDIADELNYVIAEAGEAVLGFDNLLKDPDISNDEVVRLARLRGEAAWRGEAARRAQKDLFGRKRELGIGGDIIGANPKREDGKFGRFGADGKPLIGRVPVGNKDINTQAAATKYLEEGGNIIDVPDEYLAKAIRANPTRFVHTQKDDEGINDVDMYEDKKNGRFVFIKTAGAGPHEAPAEMFANQLAAQMGFPVGAMRAAGPTTTGKKGWGRGKQAAPIMFEHAGVLFDGQLGKPGRDAQGITDVKTFVRGMLLDFIIANEDRHGGNFFFNRRGADGVGFVPIDHGLAFPRRAKADLRPDDWYIKAGRVQWPRELKRKIDDRSFTAEEVADEIGQVLAGLSSQDVDQMIAQIADVMPDSYDHMNEGDDWQNGFSHLVKGRLDVFRTMSRNGILAYLGRLPS